MNWKRGFRRIAFISAIFSAIVCAGLSIWLVLLIHSEAQSNLRCAEEQYKEEFKITELKIREALSTEDKTVEKEKKQPVESFDQIAPATLKPKELQLKASFEKQQKGFWVNLSKDGLVGLCGAVGSIGGIIGFVIVWLIYKSLEWLVLGFCDNNRLQPEKT